MVAWFELKLCEFFLADDRKSAHTTANVISNACLADAKCGTWLDPSGVHFWLLLAARVACFECQAINGECTFARRQSSVWLSHFSTPCTYSITRFHGFWLSAEQMCRAKTCHREIPSSRVFDVELLISRPLWVQNISKIAENVRIRFCNSVRFGAKPQTAKLRVQTVPIKRLRRK